MIEAKYSLKSLISHAPTRHASPDPIGGIGVSVGAGVAVGAGVFVGAAVAVGSGAVVGAAAGAEGALGAAGEAVAPLLEQADASINTTSSSASDL
jgi:hypothetical protein